MKNLVINGEIILEGEVIDDDFASWGYPGFCPGQVRDALAQFAGQPVTIRLNSIGGFATEGEAIRALIARHDGDVTIVIEGSAQSAASLLALGADGIEISQGSFVMIHDPSGGLFGTEADHIATAAALGVLASGYASVYAARLGVSEDEARALMRAETYWNAPQAVEIGFADRITESAATASASAKALQDLDAVRASAAERAAAMMHQFAIFKAGGPAPKPHQPAAPRGIQKEPEKMTTTPPKTTSTPPAPAPVAPDMAQATAAARMAERARISAIRAAGAPFIASGVLTEEDLATFIDSDASAEAVKAAMLDKVVDRQTASGGGQRAHITRDETDTKLEGMIGALAGETSGPAMAYRGLRVKGLARMLGGDQGYNESATIRRGMGSTALMSGAQGVTDFAFITGEAMGRRLVAEYERRDPTWREVTGEPMQAADFRELAPVTFGGDFALKGVMENGEYKSTTLSDRGEGFKVERRGRQIILTFEAVVNDDMSAFSRIPGNFALAARQMESSMVWALIRNNSKLKSGNKAFFHADHGNLAPSGAVISVASVGAMRAMMWNQKAQGAKADDDFIQVTPNRLIVPPALETVALQFVSGTTPAKDSDANPYKNTMQVVVVPELGASVQGGSDTAWYLASSDLPAIAAAYLDGFEGPSVVTDEGMNPDRVVMTARHIFGAGTNEPRGMNKNLGA